MEILGSEYRSQRAAIFWYLLKVTKLSMGISALEMNSLRKFSQSKRKSHRLNVNSANVIHFRLRKRTVRHKKVYAFPFASSTRLFFYIGRMSSMNHVVAFVKTIKGNYERCLIGYRCSLRCSLALICEQRAISCTRTKSKHKSNRSVDKICTLHAKQRIIFHVNRCYEAPIVNTVEYTSFSREMNIQKKQTVTLLIKNIQKMSRS